MAKKLRHWLDKAAPRYWTAKGYWRVRAMKLGQPFQWLIKEGRGDASSTGRALAWAEWANIKRQILATETSKSEVEAGGDFYWNWTPAERREHDEAQTKRFDFNESPFAAAGIDFAEFQEFMEWKRTRALVARVSVSSNVVVAKPQALKAFRDLTAIFRADLARRLAATRPGLRSSEDISKARHDQYRFALAHMDNAIGDALVEPLGDYHVAERRLSTLLAKYRQTCVEEMEREGWGGHWFNERMKTARSLTTYLVEKRLASAEPPDMRRITEKYEIEANPTPVPVPMLKLFWQEADDRFRGLMLVALNCGFRQTEIASLQRKHLKTVANRSCVVKRRGKTGVPLAIPLWDATKAAIETYGGAESLFQFEGDPIDAIGNRLGKIRARVAKRDATAVSYSFENLRDTGASFIETINPMLTPLYLGQSDGRSAKHYVGQIESEDGNAVMPMQLDVALDRFERYLGLPAYAPTKLARSS